jgi:hypothetical protein
MYLLPVDADETTKAIYRKWNEILTDAIARATND